MYPFLYTVEYYDEINYKLETIQGITFADNFTEAAERIENYYGEMLESVTINIQEESTVWEFDPESKQATH